MKENLDYKVKIDIPNITELISETFDGVLDHMFPGMLVFGGALRDIVAGFGLHHDLDIAASHSEGGKFIQYLETSSKWVEECVVDQYKKQARIMEDKISDIVSPHSMENGMLDLNRNLPCITKPKFSNYGNIQNVRTFINPSGRKLQVIIGKSNLFTLKEQSSILIVKSVDFICCGIIMDIDGNVYEIIEGAKDDCVKKILRINKNVDIKFHDLNKRIKKLTNRGWESKINLAQIKHKQTRLKRITERKTNEYPSNSIIQRHTLSGGMTQMVINTSKMRIFRHCNNSDTKILELFYSIFENHDLTRTIRNCEVNVSYDNYGHTVISVIGRNTETTTKLEKALLYQEHKFSPLSNLSKPKKCGYFSGKVTKFVDQSLRISISENKPVPMVYDYCSSNLAWGTPTGITSSSTPSASSASSAYILDRGIEWGEAEIAGDGRREPDLGMFKEKELKKEKLAELGEEKIVDHIDLRPKKTTTPLKNSNSELINKTELVESRSNLKITKKEKMEIEYGARLINNRDRHTHLVDNRPQHKRAIKTDMNKNNKLSEYFAEK